MYGSMHSLFWIHAIPSIRFYLIRSNSCFLLVYIILINNAFCNNLVRVIQFYIIEKKKMEMHRTKFVPQRSYRLGIGKLYKTLPSQAWCDFVVLNFSSMGLSIRNILYRETFFAYYNILLGLSNRKICNYTEK